MRVRLEIEGGGRPITATKTVARTTKGASATAPVSVPGTPPVGTPVRVTIRVDPVPGEKTRENNEQTFPVVFTR